MNQSAPPEVSLEELGVEPFEHAGQWRVRWRINNRGAEQLEINSARLPHGQFKSEEIGFDPPLKLAPSGSAEFAADVHCHEPAGFVTENAFVILYVKWGGAGWRIYVRVRVTVDESGVPRSMVGSITTQQAGFSGVAN